jgi:hypothetical protein
MKFKRILTKGEKVVLTTAEVVASSIGAEAFPKLRVADVIEIENSGISDNLYSYALRAHFDVVICRNNYPIMAVEFDGTGHDSRNDAKKAELCERFQLPLVRVGMKHVNAVNFEDSSLSFLIHQLECVDRFIENYGSDPYEPYDPAFFVSIPGRDRRFPFHYSSRWRGRLVRRLKENAHRFTGSFRDYYAHGLVSFGSLEAAFVKDGCFRCLSGLYVAADRAIWGLAELDFHVHGLEGRRRELFMELASFVDGLAAAEMFEKTITFLTGDESVADPIGGIELCLRGWQREGFRLRRGMNLPSGSY